MWSSLVEYHRPATMAKCLSLISRQALRTVPLAGGTWLVAQHSEKIEAVVDLTALNFAFIKQSARRVRLGAMTTLQAIIDTPSIQNVANGILRDAANNCASRAIRNVATLGGTIVVGDSFSEVCQALLVLEAWVVIHTQVIDVIPLKDFLAFHPSHPRRRGIISEIIIPKPLSRFGSAFAKVGRSPHGQTIVNATALVSRVGHVCRIARLSFGGVTEHPIRMPEIEGLLTNQKIDERLYNRVTQIVKKWILQYPVSEYQRDMAGVVVFRALQEAWEQVERG